MRIPDEHGEEVDRLVMSALNDAVKVLPGVDNINGMVVSVVLAFEYMNDEGELSLFAWADRKNPPWKALGMVNALEDYVYEKLSESNEH